MSAPTSHDPLVVNTADGTVWTRREAVRDGLALYAPEKCARCPEFVMATYAELEGHGIAGSADVLPVPVGPEPQALPWAHAMSDRDLHGFLDDLVSAAMGRWRSEPEVPDRTVLADIEKVCAAWRTPGLGLRLDGSEFDGAVVRLAPSRAAEVPDGEHYASVHHAYKLGHDLPETGGLSVRTAREDDDPARCLKVHPFSPRDGWRMVCGNCDHGKDADCHQVGA